MRGNPRSTSFKYNQTCVMQLRLLVLSGSLITHMGIKKQNLVYIEGLLSSNTNKAMRELLPSLHVQQFVFL